MGLLRLLPTSLRSKLILHGLLEAVTRLEAQHFGQQLNKLADAKYGKVIADPIQRRVAAWLRAVALELEA